MQTLTKRVRQLEEDFEQTETRLHTANEKFSEASKAADESERSDSCSSLYTLRLITFPAATRPFVPARRYACAALFSCGAVSVGMCVRTLGQLSLAYLRDRLVEYQLRLG